jgi:hypothetical protein
MAPGGSVAVPEWSLLCWYADLNTLRTTSRTVDSRRHRSIPSMLGDEPAVKATLNLASMLE